MMRNADIDQLISDCYKGPLEQSPWQSFMQGLQQALDAPYVTLLLRPPRDGDAGVVLNVVLHSGDAYQRYNEHYYAQDPFVDLPPGAVLTVDEVVDIGEYKQSDYYRQYLQKVDVEYILGADLVDDNGYSTQLRISRGARQCNFSASDKQLVARLLPHLRQSIELYSRIIHAQAKSDAYQQAFDQMEMGCIILDRKQQVLSRNRAADELIRQRIGLVLQERMLLVGSRDENRAFRQLVSRMLEGQAGTGADVMAFRVALPQSVTGLGLLCRALPPALTPDAGPSVAIFISHPEKNRLSRVEILQQLFELTSAEARLALLLANGLSLDEAADELGITRNT
ncbi:MAG TPA: helix-turn-helix transcriptional regulator, partial [Pseudomonadales bacterium]